MRLPALRPDLQLSPSMPATDGAPQWTLADPIRGRYFKINAGAMRLLRYWPLGDRETVLAAANAEPGLPLTGADLEQLLLFLRMHDLIVATDANQRASYALKAAAQERGPWQTLLHQYLFFRIPLWRPDAFLNRTWPWLQRYGPPALRYGLPTVFLFGLLLMARDWDRFIAAFPYLFSLAGAMAFGFALFFAKLCHEFGHAYMAKRAGCRVQSMGIAFMVMLPLFYTDVSDAWRVTDRRSRLLIGAGGMLMELLLAAIALLAWSLLDDGPLRTAMFMLASATWITTLVVNLNPFMRFDGYFLLSDWWGVDNLQTRAFALCRWQLRERLFGYGEPAPEAWSGGMQRRLLLWGYAAWVWRAALFFGIALTVYHFFFKVLGVVLMLVELAWFIGLPIAREIHEWWTRRAHIEKSRGLWSFASAIVVLIILTAPWHGSVDIPAVLEAQQASALHAPVAARIKHIHAVNGQSVRAGDLLLELESPDLDSRQTIARHQVDILQLQLRRQAGRSETASDAGVLEQQLAEAVIDYRGLAAQRARLLIRAPHAGTVRDLFADSQPGLWVSPQQPLLWVIGDGLRLRGYVQESQLWRVDTGNVGRFIADDAMRASLPVRLHEINTTGADHIELEILTSDQQGPIAVRRNEQQQAKPERGQYGTTLVLIHTAEVPAQPLRGVVVLDGRGESLIGALWRRVFALLIRESGF